MPSPVLADDWLDIMYPPHEGILLQEPNNAAAIRAVSLVTSHSSDSCVSSSDDLALKYKDSIDFSLPKTQYDLLIATHCDCLMSFSNLWFECSVNPVEATGSVSHCYTGFIDEKTSTKTSETWASKLSKGEMLFDINCPF